VPERVNRRMKVTHSDSPDAPIWARPSTAKSRRGVAFPSPVEARKQPVAEAVKLGERLYTCADAGEATGTTERFWRGLVEQKRVRYVKLGKFVRIPESAISQLLAEGTVEPL
jgi:excisionase family DNA binding protein